MAPHGASRVELMRVTSGPDGAPAPYHLIFSAYFGSEAALAQAMQSADWQQVLTDVPNYFDGVAEVLVGQLITVGP